MLAGPAGWNESTRRPTSPRSMVACTCSASSSATTSRRFSLVRRCSASRASGGLRAAGARGHGPGRAVVTSRGTSTAEVAGDAARPRRSAGRRRDRRRQSRSCSTIGPLAGRLSSAGRARAADVHLGANRRRRPRPSTRKHRREALHVGVNLLWLVPGVVGGSEEYTTRLLTARLEDPPDDTDLTLFVLRPFVDAYPDLVAAFPTVICPLSGTVEGDPHCGRSNVAGRAGSPPRRRPDASRRRNDPAAASNAIDADDPRPPTSAATGNFSRTKQAYLRWRLPASARKSRLVVTLTEFTLGTIVEAPRCACRARRDRRPRLHECTRRGTGRRSANDVPTSTGPFFLYPAITYPHKNHWVLLDALAQVVTIPSRRAARADASARADGDGTSKSSRRRSASSETVSAARSHRPRRPRLAVLRMPWR